MNWLGKLFLTLATLGAFSSMMVACGRKSSDDVRVATKGNVGIEGNGVVSTSTLDGAPYSIRVYRIYRYNSGYNSGYGNGMMGYMPATGCAPVGNGFGVQNQIGNFGIYAEVQVNGICKTFAMSNPGTISTDNDLGLEMTYNCEASNNCDTVYMNIIGRKPPAYNQQGGYTALPGGSLAYGYGNNMGVGTMQADTPVKQLGVMKIITQDRVMSAIENQTVYSQRLRIDQVTTALQRTASEYNGN